MKKTTLLVLLLLLSIQSHAGIITISQNDFNAEFTESFENLFGLYHPYENERIFNNQATITGDGEWLDDHFLSMVNGGWPVETVNNGFISQKAHEEHIYIAIGGQGFVNIEFDIDVYNFGGFFSNGHINTPSIFEFYDKQDLLIDSFIVDLPSQFGEMNWAGFSSDSAIGSVKISGTDTTLDYLMISSKTQVSEPSTLFSVGLLSLLLIRARKRTS